MLGVHMAQRPRQLRPERSARDLLGAELRRHRELAGYSLAKLSGLVHVSTSHLSRIESAESLPPETLPARLDALFDTDGSFQRLHAVAINEVHPDRYRPRMALEARALMIDEYAGQIVPGLVQTEAYARALFRVFNPEAGHHEIEHKVAARLSRQDLLRRNPPPQLSMILDEAVLRRPIGGPRVMRDQFSRLIDLMHSPTTVIQLIPFAHGEHALLGGTLTLMRLDNGSTVAYEESIDTGQLIDDPAGVLHRRQSYDRLRSHAMSPADTATLLQSALEAYAHEHSAA